MFLRFLHVFLAVYEVINVVQRLTDLKNVIQQLKYSRDHKN
jgi:hypothetical protein